MRRQIELRDFSAGPTACVGNRDAHPPSLNRKIAVLKCRVGEPESEFKRGERGRIQIETVPAVHGGVVVHRELSRRIRNGNGKASGRADASGQNVDDRASARFSRVECDQNRIRKFQNLINLQGAPLDQNGDQRLACFFELAQKLQLDAAEIERSAVGSLAALLFGGLGGIALRPDDGSGDRINRLFRIVPARAAEHGDTAVGLFRRRNSRRNSRRKAGAAHRTDPAALFKTEFAAGLRLQRIKHGRDCLPTLKRRVIAKLIHRIRCIGAGQSDPARLERQNSVVLHHHDRLMRSPQSQFAVCGRAENR